MAETTKGHSGNPHCECDPCECDPCLCGSTTTTASYKGRTLTITHAGDNAIVEVDGREFRCNRHHGGHHGSGHDGHSSDAEPVGMPMWMCEEAYFGAFDLIDLARHFADYGYMFNDPNRVVCDNDGNVVQPGAKKSTPRKSAAKKSAAKKSAAKKSTSKKSAAKKSAANKSR